MKHKNVKRKTQNTIIYFGEKDTTKTKKRKTPDKIEQKVEDKKRLCPKSR